MPTHPMELILEDTMVCLWQGIQLMAQLKPELYAKPHSSCYGSSVGGHVRHNLDHFFCFKDGIEPGEVDYDARTRSTLLETDPQYAAAEMEGLVEFLASLDSRNLDKPLKVKMDSGSGSDQGDSKPWSHSSIRRELQFLISHTIHHYALIATLCAFEGLELPENFGVAPSTLRFRKSRDAQCAR